jgi:hypothetical protein
VISGSNGRTDFCTIQAASGATVTFRTLTTNADWLTIRNMDSHTGETTHMGSGGCVWCDQEGGSHLVLDNVNLYGKWADGEISGGSVHATATDITWEHSQLGTAGNTADRLCGQDDEPFRISGASDILIAYDTFHPFRGEEGGGCGAGNTLHLETFRLWDTNDGLTFLSNHFDDNNGDDSFTIFAGKGGCSSCPETKNVKIVNNYFGNKCCGYAAPDVGYGDQQSCTGQGWVFAYNSFHSNGDAGLGNYCTNETNTIYVGNIGYNTGGCPVGGTNTANVWIAPNHGSCTGNTWLSGAIDDPTPYKLAPDGEHLTSTSPLINAGETTLCQQYTGGLDIDGKPRTSTCDAGPDEYGN